MRVSRSLDTVAVIFDDDNLVANAGLILPATLAQHLGLEALINERVRLTDPSAGFRPGRKALTLVHSGDRRRRLGSTTATCSGPGRVPPCWAMS